VWYSKFLAQQYPGSLLVTEIFNRYHMNMYHVRDQTGAIRNYHEPIINGFYKEYYLDDNNFLTKKNIMGIRSRSVDEEEQYCFNLLKKTNPAQTLILHNHIDPIHCDIRSWLIEQAAKNIWIYRQDKRQQIASYAVALSTKKFAAFNKAAIGHEPVADCDVVPLHNLIRRIKVWDSFSKQDTIAFEEIKFFDAPGFPLDQNSDAWSRLSDRMKTLINELVIQYENN
jgi:hypothetical protein